MSDPVQITGAAWNRARSAGAPTAFAQDTPPAGSLRLLTSRPAAPSVAAPEPDAPAAATPGAGPTGWAGPLNYSPAGLAELIGRVCRPAMMGDGGDIIEHARELGLGSPAEAPHEMSRALPPGTVIWKVPSLDGELYLSGYGEAPLRCGAVVVRPMPEAGFNKLIELLQGVEQGFVQESAQVLPGDARWLRLRSPRHEFVDVMEYPPSGDYPGVLRAEFLPE